MTDQLDGQESLFGPDTPSMKTSQDLRPQTTAKTSRQSSRTSSASSSRKLPIFLRLTRADGPTRGGLIGVGTDGQPFSVAWRLHDAQYHGVPQRRKRYCVLADLAGITAPWILFDPQFERTTETGEPVSIERDTGDGRRPEVQAQCQGVPGDIESGRTAREGASAGTESGAGSAGEDDHTICLQGNGIDRAETARCNGAGWRRGGSYTINTIDRPAVVSFQERAGKPGGAKESSCNLNTSERSPRSTTSPSLTEEPTLLESNQNHATITKTGVSTTLPAAMGEGGGYVPMVAGFSFGQSANARSLGYEEEKSPTIRGGEGGNQKPCALTCGNPWDSQSERVYHGDGAWHNLSGNCGGGQSRDAILHRR